MTATVRTSSRGHPFARLAQTCLVAGGLLGLASVASAGPVAYLQGIGVNTTTSIGSNDRATSLWKPTAAGVSYVIEDSSSGGFVGPGYGGQPYDLEALYVQRTASQLIITGVSGALIAKNPAAGTSSATCLSPNCDSNYGMGDFFLGTRNAAGAFMPRIAIETTGHYFSMNSSGHTTGWSSPLAAGRIVDVSGTVSNPAPSAASVGWESGLASWGFVGAPTQIASNYTTGSSAARQATMSYETFGVRTAYQAAINLADIGSLGSDGKLVIHWGEICGNDFLQVANSVSAPPSAAMLLLALPLGWFMRRRRA